MNGSVGSGMEEMKAGMGTSVRVIDPAGCLRHSISRIAGGGGCGVLLLLD